MRGAPSLVPDLLALWLAPLAPRGAAATAAATAGGSDRGSSAWFGGGLAGAIVTRGVLGPSLRTWCGAACRDDVAQQDPVS